VNESCKLVSCKGLQKLSKYETKEFKFDISKFGLKNYSEPRFPNNLGELHSSNKVDIPIFDVIVSDPRVIINRCCE